MDQLDIEYLTDLDRVTVLLHPLRLQIMELAIEETSGTDAARRLGLPRQMVNYHVSALEKAGFLVRVSDVRRRNMVERRVRASARAYLISPDILGSLSGARRRPPDPATRTALLSLAARVQRDLGSSSGRRDPNDPPALSFSSKLHFSSASSRGDFIRALGEAVVAVIREFSAPTVDGRGDSQPYGLVLGLYPLPYPSSSSISPEGDHR